MLKWLNPLWWYHGALGAFAFLKENPVGFGFTWFASGLQTMWTTAFPASLLYPDWARDIVEHVWPYLKESAMLLWEWAWSGSLGP